MKTNKWIWRVLAVILTLVVLAGIGLAGFRMGVVQGANLSTEQLSALFAHGRDFDHGMMKGGFEHGRGDFGERDGFGGRGGFGLFGFVFGLLRLAVLAGLVWFGYTLAKRSGWRLVKTEATPTPAPAQTVTEEVPSADEGDEKKESA